MLIRPASLEIDVPGIAALVNTCEPAHPVSLERVQKWLSPPDPGSGSLRLVSTGADNAVTGYAVFVHEPWMPASHFYGWIGVLPEQRCQGLGACLWDAGLDYLCEQDATRVGADVLDCDPDSLAFAKRRGFTLDRHNFPSTLDLTTFAETPFLPAIAALEQQGIRFCRLNELPDTPETRQGYYELNLATVRDIPGEDWDFDSYPQFFEKNIVGAPWFHPEHQLLALDGDRIVGFASLSLHPENQSAYNATTGVLPAYRGRGIALALKVHAAVYARGLGFLRVNTDNDSLNAPIQAINRKMGYQPKPGKYLLVRWLQEDCYPLP